MGEMELLPVLVTLMVAQVCFNFLNPTHSHSFTHIFEDRRREVDHAMQAHPVSQANSVLHSIRSSIHLENAESVCVLYQPE